MSTTHDDADGKPAIGLTMFGVTAACIQAMGVALEPHRYGRALEGTLQQTNRRRLIKTPHHINDPRFAQVIAEQFQQITYTTDDFYSHYPMGERLSGQQ